jgi:hypothetical protein
MKFFSRLPVVLMAGVISFLIIPEAALSQEGKGPVVSEPVMPVVSANVRELPVMEPSLAGGPVREIPRQVGGFQVDAVQTPPEKKTPVMRRSAQSIQYITPDPILSFDGISIGSPNNGYSA